MLQSLISELSPSGQQPTYKLAVTSTIIQHTSIPTSSSEDKDSKAFSGNGRGGMHSATGAFWNNEKDGTWSHKFEEEKKGFDVVISVIWISIV